MTEYAFSVNILTIKLTIISEKPKKLHYFISRQVMPLSLNTPVAQFWGVSYHNDTFIVTTNLHNEWLTFNEVTMLNEWIADTRPSHLCYAVPHSHIWRKICFFPKNYNQTQLHTRIIQTLRASLPIPLTQIHFNYILTPKQHAWRAALFALKKDYPLPFQIKPMPILDCELHCIARALHYLHKIPMESEEHYLYQIDQLCFSFEDDGMVFHSQIPTSHHQQLSANILMQIDSPTDHIAYLSSLGASLWNGKAFI